MQKLPDLTLNCSSIGCESFVSPALSLIEFEILCNEGIDYLCSVTSLPGHLHLLSHAVQQGEDGEKVNVKKQTEADEAAIKTTIPPLNNNNHNNNHIIEPAAVTTKMFHQEHHNYDSTDIW